MIFYAIELTVGQGETERATFINLLYFATITSSTIGYGDESPATIAGRFFGSIYMLIGVVCFALFVSAIADIPLARRRAKLETKVLTQFGKSLSDVELSELIQSANSDPNDDSCDEAEFVLAMLQKLDKVKPKQIKKLEAIFDRYDTDPKDGTLSLTEFGETEEELLAGDD